MYQKDLETGSTNLPGVSATAMINVEAEPIIAVGSAMGNIPMVDRLDQNPLEVIASGDHVKIDGDKGIVEVTKKEYQ